MSKILDWIKKHIWQSILIVLGLFFLPLILVHIAYKVAAISPWFASTWSSGDIVTYIAGFEAFIGTVFLGAISVHQNDKANELNQKAVSLNERFLQNEIRRDEFERTCRIVLKKWEYMKYDLLNAKSNNEMLFISSRFRDVLFSNDIILLEFLYKFQLTFVNYTNSYMEIEFDEFIVFTTNDEFEKTANTYLPQDPIAHKLINIQLAPNEEFNFSFLLRRSEAINQNYFSCKLQFKLINNIREFYTETIDFSIVFIHGNNPKISLRSIDIKPSIKPA